MLRRLIGFVLVLCLLPMMAFAEETTVYEWTQNGYRVWIKSSEWDNIDMSLSGFEDPLALTQYAADAIVRMVELCGEPRKHQQYRQSGSEVVLDVELCIAPGVSHVIGNHYGKTVQKAAVTYKDLYIAYGCAPIIHELAHVIYPGYMRSLREGFSCYLQDALGGHASVHNFGMDAHEIVQNIVLASDRASKLMPLIGTYRCAGTTADLQRSGYYNASYSFVKYLIETYGMETYMRIHGALEDEYVQHTGKALEQLKEDWLAELTLYESDMTAETFRQRTYETLIALGIPHEGADALSRREAEQLH